MSLLTLGRVLVATSLLAIAGCDVSVKTDPPQRGGVDVKVDTKRPNGADVDVKVSGGKVDVDVDRKP